MVSQQLTRNVWLTRVVLLASALFTTSLLGEPSDDSPATPPAAEKKTKREPIYIEEANGKELIDAAVKRAKLEGKHVLIEWGGNWCGWCFKLHDVFHKDELVRPIVAEEYELVLVDCGPNRELMESYGGKETQFAFPHLTILDAQGKVLTNQETGSLEIGPKHDPEAVAAFLKKWQPEQTDAEELLIKAVKQAADEDKRVLLHVGNPYCGWCRVLAKFLAEHSTQLSGDYIDLKIDTLRMKNGKEVAKRFAPGESAGVPWMVILDGSGEVISTSIGPEGNVGYPLRPQEIEHFLAMLSDTKQRLRDEDLQQIRKDLDAYRIEREERQKVQAAAKQASTN